ncbi:adenylylsulfatase HINT3 isoform X1 [Olea europaea subsp. europaea]|uniref:Adenylylsulfatase HINT3 isoform X1 n=1 Tax=Olea europaea subsp. europaea TaxID=158383 RepID=A0A8S0UKC6_OLEEU|nr:adenylylsulfatase HINT3 isoform X1 [Olea europaea subsp. europaea]
MIKMESLARRRLLILSSHINPPAEILRPVSPLLASTSASEKGEKDNYSRSDCVFCNIIRGEAPALKVYEDDECLCILDTNPLCHGHSLIIPKRHFSSLDATPPAIIGAMCSKVPLISNAVMKATGCDAFNLLVNNGASAGQVVFHTHIHIIPRKAHDCLWASESLRRRPLTLDKEAAHLAKCIRENFTSSNNLEAIKGQASSLMGSYRER